MKMKRTDRMIERHRTWIALRRARETFGQEAAECWQIDDKELSRLHSQGAALPPTPSREWRSARLHTVAASLLVSLLLSLVVLLGLNCVRPATDGYAMSRVTHRVETIVMLNALIRNI